MKIGERYSDKYANIIEIISDDYANLGRDIVYAQIVNRWHKKVTKQMMK